MFTRNKSEKAKKKQDIMDQLLKPAYPFISEGRGFTSALTRLALPFNIKVLLKYLPEGKEDSASLILGQLWGKPLSVKIWKDGGEVFCSHDIYEWRSQPVDVRGQEEVTLAMLKEELLLSAPQPVFKHNGCTISNALLLHRLLATGKEEQVVSRRGELNRDLVKRTCTWRIYSKTTVLHLAAWYEC